MHAHTQIGVKGIDSWKDHREVEDAVPLHPCIDTPNQKTGGKDSEGGGRRWRAFERINFVLKVETNLLGRNDMVRKQNASPE